MHSLATAARSAGMPGQLEDLEAWKPGSAVVVETLPLTDGGNAETIGEPWRIPHAAESAQRMRVFEVDVGIAERGMLGHIETEKALAASLCALGISPLSPRQGDPPFDVGWIHDGRFFVAEVKSITPENEEHQLRLGLGQVLRYKYALSSTEYQVKPVLVPEAEPRDATWFEVCESVGVALLSGPDIAGQLRGVLD